MSEEILKYKPADLVPCPTQPRRFFDSKAILELADSIRAFGMQSPILVRKRPGRGKKVEIAFGERRWRAATEIVNGYSTLDGEEIEGDPNFQVPCMICKLNDKELLEVQLVENLQREDMTPMEEAEAFGRLINDYGESVRSVAEKLSIPKSRVFERYRLLGLPEQCQRQVDSGEIPIYAANLALSIPETAESRVEGLTAVEDALRTAVDAKSLSRAKEAVDARYIRPERERKQWLDSREQVEQRIYQFAEDELDASALEGTDWEILSYAESRSIFDPDVTELYSTLAGEYVWAHAFPDLAHDSVAPGKDPGAQWGELALRYGAKLYAAADGKMGTQILCRRDLVIDAARIAHKDDPLECPFLAADAAAQREQKQEAKQQRDKEEENGKQRYEEVIELLRKLDEAIRSGPGDHEFFLRSVVFIAQVGALGYEGSDNAANHLMLALEIPEEESDEEMFCHWPGLFSTDLEEKQRSIESLCVCAQILYEMDGWPLEMPLEDCPAWIEAKQAYLI